MATHITKGILKTVDTTPFTYRNQELLSYSFVHLGTSIAISLKGIPHVFVSLPVTGPFDWGRTKIHLFSESQIGPSLHWWDTETKNH